MGIVHPKGPVHLFGERGLVGGWAPRPGPRSAPAPQVGKNKKKNSLVPAFGVIQSILLFNLLQFLGLCWEVVVVFVALPNKRRALSPFS